MKRYLHILLIPVLLCTLSMTGCQSAKSIWKYIDNFNVPAETHIQISTESTSTTEPTTEPSTDPAEPPKPERPFATYYPYLEKLPGETCIFKSADINSDFVQTIGADGTFTITKEVRADNGDLWGRLKSGIGWVNLTDPYCHGPNLPALTASSAGKGVQNSAHIRLDPQDNYFRVISFIAHRPITNLRIDLINADEFQRTVHTLDRLDSEMPLVAYLSFAGDFYGYLVSYTDELGAEHTIQISESLKDGSLHFTY